MGLDLLASEGCWRLSMILYVKCFVRLRFWRNIVGNSLQMCLIFDELLITGLGFASMLIKFKCHCEYRKVKILKNARFSEILNFLLEVLSDFCYTSPPRDNQVGDLSRALHL